MQWREQWQLIDFDATVRIGMPAGSKHSVACAPPELLEDIGGRIAPILSTATNALLAHPSFDSWSFGVLLFHLLTGRPLFNQTVKGFLDGTKKNEAETRGQTTSSACLQQDYGRVRSGSYLGF